MNSKSMKCAMLLNILKKRSYTTRTKIQQHNNHYDIIVAGGGMIGSTLACTLGKNTKLSNKRILLLDSAKAAQSKTLGAYSNRVSALNPSTFNLLNNIGAWKHIEKARFGQVKKLQVWDSISNAAISFKNNEFDETITYIVENDLLVDSVMKEIKTLTNVKVINEANLKSCTFGDTSHVTMQDGKNYTCSLLLGCDGANSQVRKSMGVQYISWNYHQKGVVATVTLSEPTNNIIAWQRFLPTGPIALLPLTDTISSLVWTTTNNQANHLLELSDEKFVDALNDAIWKVYPTNEFVNYITKSFDKLLDSFQLPSTRNRPSPPRIKSVESKSRAAFPLGFGHAASYVGKGVGLVGDAAHRVHPLAGQGVNLGFGDIAALNRILSESLYSGFTLNATQALANYETERQRSNIPTMLAIDGLQKLYGTDWSPVVIVRSLGLQLTHALNPVKKAIMAHAGQ